MAGVFKGLETISKAFGVVTALIGFPAALFAAYNFSAEIRDTLTPPDVDVSFPRLELRCFYRFQDQAAYEAFRAGDNSKFVENCNASRMAVSFRVAYDNMDTVQRTVTGISLSLDLPEGAPEVQAVFDQVWEITHRIEGVLETSTRLPWDVTPVAAGSRVHQDLWLIQTAPGDQSLFWRDVLAWLTSQQAVDGPREVTGRLTAVVSGRQVHFACQMMLRDESLERFRSFDPMRQLRFTGRCS